MTNQILSSTLSPDMTLEEKLKAIEEAMKQANGDPKKESKMLQTLVDPQDALQCEGCQ